MEYKRTKTTILDCYEVDTVGNIFSTKFHKDGIKLKARRNTAGYHQVKLYDKGVPKQLLVHRLMYEAFVGEIPEGMTIDHIDGDIENNTIENLQLMTHADNIKKAWDRRGRSKVKPIIKDWVSRGYNRQFIVDNLGVSHAYISLIVNDKR